MMMPEKALDEDDIQMAGLVGQYNTKIGELISISKLQGLSPEVRKVAIKIALGTADVVKRAICELGTEDG